MSGSSSGAGGISWPGMLPALPPQSSPLHSFVATGHSPTALMEKCPNPLSCLPAHGEVEAEALGYLLAWPSCWVFKHRCLLLLTLSDKWRHFFHRKESQEFPCSLFILFFFSLLHRGVESVTGEGVGEAGTRQR